MPLPQSPLRTSSTVARSWPVPSSRASAHEARSRGSPAAGSAVGAATEALVAMAGYGPGQADPTSAAPADATPRRDDGGHEPPGTMRSRRPARTGAGGSALVRVGALVSSCIACPPGCVPVWSKSQGRGSAATSPSDPQKQGWWPRAHDRRGREAAGPSGAAGGAAGSGRVGALRRLGSRGLRAGGAHRRALLDRAGRLVAADRLRPAAHRRPGSRPAARRLRRRWVDFCTSSIRPSTEFCASSAWPSALA